MIYGIGSHKFLKGKTPHPSAMLRNFDKYFISHGILSRKTRNADFKNYQIVLLYLCRKKVFEFIHSDLGHPGREKTLGFIQDRFYWFGMTRDVENFVKSCSRCIFRKASTEKASLVNMIRDVCKAIVATSA